MVYFVKRHFSMINKFTAIVIVLITMIFSSTALAHNDDTYAYSSNLGLDARDWMNYLPDNMRLSDMSLLMTHDTMTYSLSDGNAPQGVSYITQRMSLQTQLDSGIRAIDIRLKWNIITQEFDLYHALEYLGFEFQTDVLDKLKTFLAANPSETIVMYIRHELGEQDESHFNVKIASVINNNSDLFWYPGTGGNNPTLGAARGKIILMRAFDHDDITNFPGIKESDWDSATGYAFNDTAEGFRDKWDKVKDHFKKIKDSTSDTLYLTGLNVATLGSKPWFSASGHDNKYNDSDHRLMGNWIEDEYFTEFERTNCFTNVWGTHVCDIYFLGMNNKAFTYIEENNMTRAGIVTVDFPGPKLVDQFIELNFNFDPGYESIPPTAVCKAFLTVNLGADGTASISGADIDNGSSDNSGIASMSVSPAVFSCTDIGTSTTVTLTVKDPSGNAATCNTSVTVKDDTSGPLITLIGDQYFHIECNEAYEEPGATAIDVCEGDTLSVTASDLLIEDPTMMGYYTVTYSAEDVDGNTSNTTRYVWVGFSSPPVITLNGPNPLNIECNDPYQEFGATAIDDCDGELDNFISTDLPQDAEQGNIPFGEYYITYQASDNYGSQAETIRTVLVGDTIAPVITLAGDNPFYILQGQAYSLPGATATDACEGDLTDMLQVDSSAIDSFSRGGYHVIYQVTDASGNSDITTRTVIVTGDDDGDGVVNELDICYGDDSVDTDHDGIPDACDLCPSTPASETVDDNGCSATQLDDDGDSVNNAIDQCPGTPLGEAVDLSGCSVSQSDAVSKVQKIIVVVDSLDAGVFKKGQRKKLEKDLNKVIKEIEKGNDKKALKELNKVLEKTDGCALRGKPDSKGKGKGKGKDKNKEDSIQDCTAQSQIYPMVLDAIALLQ